MSKSQKLRSEAMKLQERAKSIFDNPNATEAELKEFDDLTAKRDALLAEAASIEAREDRLNAFDAADIARDPREKDRTLPHNDEKNVGTRHRYSLLKAFREADPRNKHVQLSGLELEVHQELQKTHTRAAKGLLIPWDLEVDLRSSGRFRRASGIERRDLNLSNGAGAVAEVTSATMIELLRNMMVMRMLGARVITGLQGNFSLPKQTGAATAYWTTGEAAVTESQQTIGSVDFSPSTLGAFTDYTRAFLSQTSVDAEAFIREDLATVIAIEMDRTGINGSGSGAEPEGIIPNSSVNVVALGTDGAALTWAKLVEMEREVEVDNALTGNVAFLTTPKARAKMKTTTKVASSTFGDFLWDRDNTANGYPAYSSNQVPSTLTKGSSGATCSACILGDFSPTIYAMWGVLETLIDPYTLGSSGGVRIVTLQDCDFQVRHPVAFSVIKDYVTT